MADSAASRLVFRRSTDLKGPGGGPRALLVDLGDRAEEEAVAELHDQPDGGGVLGAGAARRHPDLELSDDDVVGDLLVGDEVALEAREGAEDVPGPTMHPGAADVGVAGADPGALGAELDLGVKELVEELAPERVKANIEIRCVG